MAVIHIMQDGSRRDSIEGIVIHNEDFYRVLKSILDSRKEKSA